MKEVRYFTLYSCLFVDFRRCVLPYKDLDSAAGMFGVFVKRFVIGFAAGLPAIREFIHKMDAGCGLVIDKSYWTGRVRPARWKERRERQLFCSGWVEYCRL